LVLLQRLKSTTQHTFKKRGTHFVLTMKLSIGLLTFWVALAMSQGQECTKELIRTDECADVINANACYNKNRFNGAGTLDCVDGKDKADKAKKICKCCSCVGKVMCDWATKQKLC
jgi:hypothetical protein